MSVELSHGIIGPSTWKFHGLFPPFNFLLPLTHDAIFSYLFYLTIFIYLFILELIALTKGKIFIYLFILELITLTHEDIWMNLDDKDNFIYIKTNYIHVI